VAHQYATTFAQSCCRQISDIHRTESEGDPRESKGESLVKPEIANSQRGEEFDEGD
jgi:hypothetical protein